ncbi:hypothetical protein FOZ60_016881 [Perkinsus olseni]|uniref:Uncharacterized protein n=1 Tax=Perkinsus olseni TaxID=32597 RepID=A0A7J6UA54_PEROL|nr:hypothetical protein FOZ60_016881 [Perkinsus olseni]KAF4753821.1 hypothetical protein FOZ62_028266 [Perkinsus olseni]
MSNDGKFREHLENSADFYSGFASLSPRQIVVASIAEWTLKERRNGKAAGSSVDTSTLPSPSTSAITPKSEVITVLGDESRDAADSENPEGPAKSENNAESLEWTGTEKNGP